MTNNNRLVIDKTILLPIAMIFSVAALQDLLYSIAGFIRNENPNFIVFGLDLIFLVLLFLSWIYWFRQNRKAFYYISVVICLILISGTLFNILNSSKTNPPITDLLFSLTHFPFILLLFLLLFYRKQLLFNVKSGVDILIFLGTLFVFRSLFSIVFNAVSHGYFDYFSIPTLIVGVGILARERFFGLFGSFVLIVLPYMINNQLLHNTFNQSVVSAIFSVIQISLFPTCVFVILLILNKVCFKYNFFATTFTNSGYSSKSCSNCGRQVPYTSTAGQRCPYCGAYWSSEHIINK
jgi:hypothetical protein